MAEPPPETSDPTPPAGPRPRSPPKYPDICGRHRLQVEVQILNREIGFLQEELQSLEEAQTVSICCKEVDDFIGTLPDPLIPQKKKHNSRTFLNSLRSKLCCNFSWLCCCSCPSSILLRDPRRCACDFSDDCSCCKGKHGLSCRNCIKNGCGYQGLTWPRCSCGCVWYCCPNCAGQRFYCCDKARCTSQCLC